MIRNQRTTDDWRRYMGFLAGAGIFIATLAGVGGCGSDNSNLSSGSSAGCTDTCTPQSSTCAPFFEGVMRCESVGGCWAWAKATPCPAGELCKDNACTADCTPSCGAKNCGDDGCGGSCGSCNGGKSCVYGICIGTCTPSCGGKECGGDGCGGTCGSCPSAAPVCSKNTCVAACTEASEYCQGTTLFQCSKTTGILTSITCSKASCVKAGYIDFSNCGSNEGKTAKFCLCTACTSDDNSCDGAVARSCNAATSKMSVTTCAADKVCVAGGCVVPCNDECNAASCSKGQQVSCGTGVDGCLKKLAMEPCKYGEVCAPGMEGCGPCEKHSECPADEVCGQDGACSSPYAVKLKIIIGSVIFPEKTPTGAAWDAFGGLPDPMVCLTDKKGNKLKDDTLTTACTSVQKNLTKAFFNETVVFNIAADQKLCLVAYDADFASDDVADSICYNNVAALVKDGGKQGFLYNNVVQVSFWIDTAK